MDTHLDPRGRYLLFGSFLVVGAVAVLDGCPPLLPGVFLVLAALAHVISSARMDLLRRALARLEQRHQELARARQRGQEQDRLSSLGMLAAGVAHEINNPLAYVKSNVNALYRNLQAHPQQLPPVLGEYVTEVLPATLQGIDRIATTVSDLRRFARGDPEPLTEYELNTEVEAAVRMTHGRIVPLCELVVELGKLPRMTGRPQQMMQVVRDTGHGMTPEVREKLFQPFFSTRPLGEGTGMGLAVVHGIVSAHGGRIHVESQPGEGSTLTIRLPRAPTPMASGEPGR